MSIIFIRLASLVCESLTRTGPFDLTIFPLPCIICPFMILLRSCEESSNGLPFKRMSTFPNPSRNVGDFLGMVSLDEIGGAKLGSNAALFSKYWASAGLS